MITIYTLKTCDTCKKALRWLDENSIEYTNHDVRSESLDKNTIEQIVEAIGWEKALNRRSTTWRNLQDSDKVDTDNIKAIDLILQHPTLMKRPVVIKDNRITVAFDEQMKNLVLET